MKRREPLSLGSLQQSQTLLRISLRRMEAVNREFLQKNLDQTFDFSSIYSLLEERNHWLQEKEGDLRITISEKV
ncbi:hypothetical protein [Heliorestis convoluta]|nr:hypothetical protein [Heliorestis convoluta]